jgi:hypothetical protein
MLSLKIISSIPIGRPPALLRKHADNMRNSQPLHTCYCKIVPFELQRVYRLKRTDHRPSTSLSASHTFVLHFEPLSLELLDTLPTP